RASCCDRRCAGEQSAGNDNSVKAENSQAPLCQDSCNAQNQKDNSKLQRRFQRKWLLKLEIRWQCARCDDGCTESEEFVSYCLPFTHGFDRFGIERPATEAIGTRVSRGPVSYGHGQRTAGIAFVALLDQLRARLRRVGNRCSVQVGCTRQGRIEWKPDLVPKGDFTAWCTKRRTMSAFEK